MACFKCVLNTHIADNSYQNTLMCYRVLVESAQKVKDVVAQRILFYRADLEHNSYSAVSLKRQTCAKLY